MFAQKSPIHVRPKEPHSCSLKRAHSCSPKKAPFIATHKSFVGLVGLLLVNYLIPLAVVVQPYTTFTKTFYMYINKLHNIM